MEALEIARPGPHLNAWQGELPRDARSLAVLMERGLVAAYQPRLDFEVALYAGSPRDYMRLAAELT